MSSPERHADVLVVGCGPVGVMAALRCAQRGLSVLAIDRSTSLFPHPRAIGLDDEGQRLFRRAGLGPMLDTETTALAGAEFVDAAGERVVGFDLPPGFTTPLGQPPTVMFEQPTLEGALRAHAVEAGVSMHLGVEATSIEHGDESVLITVDVAGESQRWSAQWLIAADGASSSVREMVGVKLVDQGFDQRWLVVDTTQLDSTLQLPTLATQHCDPARVVTFVPGHAARRRWEFQLAAHETDEQVQSQRTLEQLLSRWARPDQLAVDRTAVYRFHGLVADRFRVGRVFLAGDAAHQMPPFNGQGMSSGLRDAENLAWKLALVTKGLAGDRLLDTYDAERRPHSIAAVAHSCDAGRLIDAIAAGRDVSPDSGYGGGRPFPHLIDGFVTGDHHLVGRQVPAALASRQENDDLLTDWFTLLTPSTGLALGASWRDLPIDELLVEDMAETASFVFVRPDGYVCAAGLDPQTELADLLAHLE